MELAQVEGIVSLCARHIKEGALPLLHCFQALDPGKHGVCPGGDAHGSARHHGLGILTRNGLFVEMEELGPRLDGGPETKVALHEGREGREGDDRVSGKMVWLEAEEVKERAKQIGGGEAESPFEVSEENDPFAGSGGRDVLFAR